MDTERLIDGYYAASNASEVEALLSILTEYVAHDINQAGRKTGREAFGRFMDRMNRCYRERIEDIAITISADGRRTAAEFAVPGRYLASDEGPPSAHGQTYRLPAVAFFEIRDGRIARVTKYCDLADRIAQVGAK